MLWRFRGVELRWLPGAAIVRSRGVSSNRPKALVKRVRSSERWEGLSRRGRKHWRVGAKSLYDVLSLAPDATAAEIKAAYRKLARQYHPDLNPGAQQHDIFQEIMEAYRILSSRELRRQYDKSQETGQTSAIWDGRVGSRGEDAKALVGLSMTEAALGCRRYIRVTAMSTCPDCQGRGTKAAAVTARCPVCKGLGSIDCSSAAAPGRALKQRITCPACLGRRTECKELCERCAGCGRASVKKAVQLSVPAGMADGCLVRVRRQGGIGIGGGPPGDLLVRFQVADSEKGLQRVGQTVHTTVKLPLIIALLGGSTVVPTLRGESKVDVAPGAQHGDVVVLPRQGVPELGNTACVGNQLVHLHFTVPCKLTERELLLVTQLRALRQAALGSRDRPNYSDFFRSSPS